MRIHPIARLAVLAVVAVTACRTVLTDISNAPVASVEVAPDSTDLPLGSTMRMRAYPLDASGAFKSGLGVQWASADPSIASVDDTGGVVAMGNGTVSIMATVDGIQGIARVRVGPPPVMALSTTTIQFSGQAGQASPPAQTVQVTNSGGLSLTGLATGPVSYGPGATAWLTAQFDTTAAPATLTLTALTFTLTMAGTYQATVPVISSVATNSPQNIAVTLVVSPAPPATYRMMIVSGDNQETAAGTALAASPVIAVTDSFGNPVSGLPVTFTVVAGGGNVTGATVNTDAAGHAAAGSWTVEAAGAVPNDGRFINLLQASAVGAGSVTFSGYAYFTYDTHVHPIWAAQGCTGCHGGLGGLFLDGTASATYTNELYDQATACAFTGRQVAPGGGTAAEANSLLMLKLDHTAPAACPGGMPSSTTLIPAATRDTIRAWIRAGAREN